MSAFPTRHRSTSIAFLFVVTLLLMNTATAWAEITVYTDKSTWENALAGPFVTEDFSDEELNAGVDYDSAESGHINPAHEYYQDVLMSASNNEPFTTWSFSPQIVAYGGNWDLGGPGGGGNSLQVYIDDTSQYVGAIGNDYGGEFWGFISNSPFTSVSLIGGTGNHQQNYTLDDMVYSAVPEPGTLSLLLSGALIGIGLTIRRRRDIA